MSHPKSTQKVGIFILLRKLCLGGWIDILSYVIYFYPEKYWNYQCDIKFGWWNWGNLISWRFHLEFIGDHGILQTGNNVCRSSFLNVTSRSTKWHFFVWLGLNWNQKGRDSPDSDLTEGNKRPDRNITATEVSCKNLLQGSYRKMATLKRP